MKRRHMIAGAVVGWLGAAIARTPEALASPTDEHMSDSTGPWSRVIRGVRARLELERGEPVVGTPILRAYLVIENVSDVGNTLEFPLDLEEVRWQVLDESGAPAPPYAGPFSGPHAPIGALRLPFDSRLRFGITRSGAGISADQAGLLCLRPDAVWGFSPEMASAHRYFLSGSIEIPKSAHRVWHGVLELPAVRLPISASA